MGGDRTRNISLTISIVWRQCDQIRRFLKFPCDKFSTKVDQKYDEVMGFLEKNNF